MAELCSKLPDNEQKLKYIKQTANKLAKTNPRFNRAKFMQACGVKQ